MPDNISRRRFLRQASVGTIAAGAVTVGGIDLLGGTASAAPVASPHHPETASSPDTSVLEESGIVAHVTDAETGRISILVGTREISYTNRDMAQQLLRAAQ